MIQIHRLAVAFVALAGTAVVANSPRISADVFDAAVVLQTQQDELALTLKEGSAPPKLGLPSFLVEPGGDAALTAAAATLTEVLWNDLDFEREFYVIPRTSSAAIPSAPADALPVQRWRELGADDVLVGSVRRNGDTLVVNVRFVSVRPDSPGKQGFGAEYGNCRMQNPRFCAHSIADHVHKQVRRLDGVARTKLAFSSDRDGARMRQSLSPGSALGKEIYFSDYDGANQMRFTVNGSLNIGPSWSPTDGLLAYTSFMTENQADIYVANLGQVGRALARPARGTASIANHMASWSPDGTKLAFVSNRSGPYSVWIVNRDGSGLQNLTIGTDKGTDNWAPTWSPSGNQIAFASTRQGRKQLYVINVNGTVAELLVSEEIDRPTWSSQNFIAFTMKSGAGWDIALYDIATRRTRVLTDGLGKNESPAVAPNGRHIAFVTTRWGREEIATIDRDGTKVRRVTQTGNNTYPSWQPMTPSR